MLPIVAAQDLRKSYGSIEAVGGISFEIHTGSCVGLLGPNGAGKSTLIGMMAGTVIPSHGLLELFGVPVNHMTPEGRAKVAIVPQDNRLDMALSARQNLLVHASFYGIPKREANLRTNLLLRLMQLHDKEHQPVHALSGGMARRLTIARALMANPGFIVLDEPTTGLDPQNRYKIWHQLIELKNAGKSFLISTHDMDEAQRLCDRVLIMDRGKILADGAPHDLIAQHVEPHVFALPKAQMLDAKRLNVRTEIVGDSVLYYVTEPKVLLPSMKGGATFAHRPANLEDVFLRLTGRALQGEE
jgi:lipooligosaccharide transport system ATP-binding protein